MGQRTVPFRQSKKRGISQMFGNFPYRLFEVRGKKSGLVVFGYSAMRGGKVGGSRANKVGRREKEIERDAWSRSGRGGKEKSTERKPEKETD